MAAAGKFHDFGKRSFRIIQLIFPAELPALLEVGVLASTHVALLLPLLRLGQLQQTWTPCRVLPPRTVGSCGFLWAPLCGPVLPSKEPFVEHGCVAKAPATLVGNRKIGMCVYFIALLCSLNGLFEVTMGHSRPWVGGTVCGHLDSNLTIRCFFEGCFGVSGEVGFGLASKLWFPQRLKALLWVARLRGGRQPLGTPFCSRTRLHAGIYFGWNSAVAIFEGAGVGN